MVGGIISECNQIKKSMQKITLILVVILIVIALVIICGGIFAYKYFVTQQSEVEKNCLSSGGRIITELCCNSVDDFPNTCFMGGCGGCSLLNSHLVKNCDCGADKCFDGKACVSLQEFFNKNIPQ